MLAAVENPPRTKLGEDLDYVRPHPFSVHEPETVRRAGWAPCRIDYLIIYGVLTLNQIDDECEVQECPDVELGEAGEDASEGFEPSEEPLDFVPPLVEVSVIGPGRDAIGLWRDYGRKAERGCRVSSPS